MKGFKHFANHDIKLNLTTNGLFSNHQNMRNYIFLFNLTTLNLYMQPQNLDVLLVDHISNLQ